MSTKRTKDRDEAIDLQSAPNQTLANVRALAKILKRYDLSELEVELGDSRIGIKRQVISPTPEPTKAQPEQLSAPQESDDSDASLKTIASPFVGTFYRAPSPEADPFINVGDTVHKGQTICIVEAMKLLNEIEAEYDARITDIVVSNAESVEYGQPLIKMRPL